jgi:hypothetical protein
MAAMLFELETYNTYKQFLTLDLQKKLAEQEKIGYETMAAKNLQQLRAYVKAQPGYSNYSEHPTKPQAPLPYSNLGGP